MDKQFIVKYVNPRNNNDVKYFTPDGWYPKSMDGKENAQRFTEEEWKEFFIQLALSHYYSLEEVNETNQTST